MQLTIVVPDEVGERVQRLPDPNRFVTEILSKALSRNDPTPETDSSVSRTSATLRRNLRNARRGRWLASMRDALKIEGRALAIEEIQAMSRETALGENELSRSVIEARER